MPVQSVVTVFCKSQSDVSEAVAEWVGVNGYRRVHTSSGTDEAAHFKLSGGVTAGFTRSSCTPMDEFKTVVVFEHP